MGAGDGIHHLDLAYDAQCKEGTSEIAFGITTCCDDALAAKVNHIATGVPDTGSALGRMQFSN